jgi:hypothetical protein
VGYRHESRHLFVADLNEFDRPCALQGPQHAVNAVAGVTVDPAHAPLAKAIDDKIADFH